MTLRTIHPFHQIRYLRVDPNPPTHNDPPTTLLPADAWVAPLSTPDMPALPPKGADTENLLLPFDGMLVLGSSTITSLTVIRMTGRRSPPSELGVLSQSQLLPMKPLPAPSREDDGWLHSCEVCFRSILTAGMVPAGLARIHKVTIIFIGSHSQATIHSFCL